MNEAKLRVQVLCWPIRNKAHVATFRHMSFDELQNLAHDALAEPFALMFPENGDVHDLKETASVTDHAAHSNGLAVMQDLHGKQAVR